MNCHESQERLHAWLDGGTLNGDRLDLQSHLRECASCREVFDAAQRLRDGLLHMPVLEPPMGFVPRVVEAVLRDRRRVIRRQWWTMAAAAAVLLAVGLWFSKGLFLSNADGPQLTGGQWHRRDAGGTEPVKETQQAEERKPPPSFRAELSEAGTATLDLTKAVAGNTARQASILVPPAEMFPRPDLPPAVEPPMLPVRDVGRTVSSGFEPVTNSARRAWDMFLRDLPPGDDQKPGL